MIQSVQDFVARMLTADNVAGRKVLEVGSHDINGSVRPYVESLKPAEYLGVDIQTGSGVDKVADCEQLVENVGNNWDIVITTEMLEHAENWRLCMEQLASATATGGLLVLTTRSPGFDYHHEPDYWRFTRRDMAHIFARLGMELVAIENDPQDFGVFIVGRRMGPPRHGELDDLVVAGVAPYNTISLHKPGAWCVPGELVPHPRPVL